MRVDFSTEDGHNYSVIGYEGGFYLTFNLSETTILLDKFPEVTLGEPVDLGFGMSTEKVTYISGGNE